MVSTVNQSANHLLAALPQNEWKRWESQLEMIDVAAFCFREWRIS